METIDQKITQLKANGYDLKFDEVINKAFENYKKIAVYAGLTILVLGFILIVVAAVGALGFIGIDQINPRSIRQLEAKMLEPDYLGYQFIGTVLLSCLFSPISAGFLKMAAAGNKDTEFKLSHFLSYYQWTYFKELIIATFIITLASTGINSALTYYSIPFVGGVFSFVVGILTVLTVPLIIFGKQTGLKAISTSIHLSTQKIGVILLLLVVAFFGSLVGLLGFCIGVLFTIPFNISMQFAIYDTIIGVEENEVATTETDDN